MSYCWFDFKDDTATCMMPKSHDGPHQPTSDNNILVSLAPPKDGGPIINITVLNPPEAPTS